MSKSLIMFEDDKFVRGAVFFSFFFLHLILYMGKMLWMNTRVVFHHFIIDLGESLTLK